MEGWMHFAVQRKRHLFPAALAGVLLVGILAPLSRRALAKTYVITDGSRVVTYTTFATDPGEVLGEAGVQLHPHDSYSAGGSDIHVSRAQQVTVTHYGKKYRTSSLGESVGELLSRLGLEPVQGDTVSHDLSVGVWEGMEIRVDRILCREETYTASIPRQVIQCEAPDLPLGTREVLVEGSDGQLLCTARVTYINARETERTVLSQTVTAAPVDRIVAVGTGQTVPPAAATEPVIGDGFIRLPTGEILTYYDTAQVRATAYTHTDEGCDFITYTGTRVRIGTVAVDPRYIPYGTRMFIVSNDGCYVYGLSVAEDCGGAIKRDRIDLYFPTYDECIQFGRRDCTIYFLG